MNDYRKFEYGSIGFVLGVALISGLAVIWGTPTTGSASDHNWVSWSNRTILSQAGVNLTLPQARTMMLGAFLEILMAEPFELQLASLVPIIGEDFEGFRIQFAINEETPEFLEVDVTVQSGEPIEALLLRAKKQLAQQLAAALKFA